ncbi:protein SLX4IP isoform 1-T3 [Spinachia spinachia]
MAPLKFAIKCGNFAVLVDLHVPPLGGREDAGCFPADHIQEVAVLVRDAVDQRVKQYTESLHNRMQHKQKKELAPAAALFVKGKNFNLAANFLKRHFNLRCLDEQLYGDLRVFPERYVVCASCPQDAAAHHGNQSMAANLDEQSRSEYFSRMGETQEPSYSPTKTKKTMLQKIAKQVQQELSGSDVREQKIDQRGEFRAAESELVPKETGSSSGQTALLEADPKIPCSSSSLEAPSEGSEHGLNQEKTENSPQDAVDPNGASLVFCQHGMSQETRRSKRGTPSDAGEDPLPRRAKRTCLGRPPATMQTHSTQTAKHNRLPEPPFPPGQSKAIPVTERKTTTLEGERPTPEKTSHRPPHTSNNTAQTNQNRLAASLRGLSVKPASSSSSISSRSTLGEGGGKNVPAASRLRRLKRS